MQADESHDTYGVSNICSGSDCSSNGSGCSSISSSFSSGG